jgi:peptide/nickel transport system substrate-binding protein
MKKLLVVILALSIATIMYNESFAEKGVFFDSVKFIQYLDENTALEEVRNGNLDVEEVRNGNLDVYYYRISSDRLENFQAREGLQVFDSTGGSYSILLNPAESEEFNPFSNNDIRFALNYLVDRKLIVNELMGGFGSPIISYYSPSDPEYLTVIEKLETFNFKYNPTLAEKIISQALEKEGAVKIDEKWQFDSKPIVITIFIRSDDPVRKSIGEILAVELQKIGFTVKKDFGDLNKAFVVVYGSNPSDLKWSLYTEGWARSAFVRYDSVGLGQMYSPWFSSMPGFNDPSYWNYKNDRLDELTQKIYTGDFESSEKRSELIQEAVVEGVNESVRIFLASKIDQYVANENVKGIVNDFGAGVPSRFTPINAKSNSDEFVIGVKQIYQGAWNPVMGLSDSYSRHIWGIISDPATFKHPFTGETFPVRAKWQVETAGPSEKLSVPQDAKIWNPTLQKWESIMDKRWISMIFCTRYISQ